MDQENRLSYSPYAPIRYQHETWWKFALYVAREGLMVADGRFKMDLPDFIMKQLIEPSMSSAAKQIMNEFPDPKDHGHLIGQFLGKFMEQRHWVPLIAQYVLNGRQIFDLTDDVVELLCHTDFGDCTLEDWQPPYDTFFLRFGKCDDIRIPWEDDFEYLDGAFVAVTPWNDDGSERRIKFGFTTSKKDGQGVMMPGYFIDFLPEEQKLPICEAVERALQRRVSSFNDTPEDGDSEKALNAHRRQEVIDGGEILKQAVALIINALFYLESIGNNRDLEPGRDTSPALTVQWANASPRQREKLKSKLLSQGYSTVYILGREIDRNLQKNNNETGSKRAHWRRGHWRRQRHGSGNAMLKRIWMKPQMIGADKVNDDLPGHVYVVGNIDNPSTRH